MASDVARQGLEAPRRILTRQSRKFWRIVMANERELSEYEVIFDQIAREVLDQPLADVVLFVENTVLPAIRLQDYRRYVGESPLGHLMSEKAPSEAFACASLSFTEWAHHVSIVGILNWQEQCEHAGQVVFLDLSNDYSTASQSCGSPATGAGQEWGEMFELLPCILSKKNDENNYRVDSGLFKRTSKLTS